MRKTVRLTMAQALVKFLSNQYINVDGTETRFVQGMMGIFGHGNVVGLGQALEQYQDDLPYMQGKNEQEIAHVCVAYAKQMRRRAIYACTASIGPAPPPGKTPWRKNRSPSYPRGASGPCNRLPGIPPSNRHDSAGRYKTPLCLH